VLFNEPKLLKFPILLSFGSLIRLSFSALQRAEIAEIFCIPKQFDHASEFQCSSTSRNC